jgi:hypothetical protein
MKASTHHGDRTLYTTWYEFRKKLGNKLGDIPLSSRWLEIGPRVPLPWSDSQMQTVVKSATRLHKR